MASRGHRCRACRRASGICVLRVWDRRRPGAATAAPGAARRARPGCAWCASGAPSARHP